MDVSFYCTGGRSEALPKLQALVADLPAWLKTRHPEVTTSATDEPVTEDDLQLGYEEGDLPPNE
jgi:hypothetical protein